MNVEQLAFTGGGGLLMGFASGYFFKKVVKIAIGITGAVIFLLAYLQHRGIITVDTTQVQATTEEVFRRIVDTIQVFTNSADIGNDLIVAMGGFGTGFVAGMIKG